MKTAQSRPCAEGTTAFLTSDAEPSASDGGLYPGMPEPLRSHMHYINAALSTYDGTACAEDVRLAWGAIAAAIKAP